MPPDEPSTTRRAFLAVTGATALTGCVGSLPTGGETDETTETTTTSDGDGADWPQLGGNAAHDGYAPEFSAGTEPSVAWETTLDGSLTTPTVVGETVYVTRGVPSDDVPEATLEAYGLDSGERRWGRSLDVEFEYGAPFSNHRPVVRGERVYVTTTDEVVAVDRETRDVVWRAAMDPFTNAPPTVTEDGVYSADDKSLVALDHAGNERWRHSVEGEWRFRLVAVDDGTVYAPAGSRLLALDAASGETQWEREDSFPLAAPAATDDSVIRASFYGVERVSSDGTRQWLADGQEEGLLRPAVGSGAAFTAGIQGTVTAYELSSGEQLWQTNVGDGEWTQETPPVLLDGSVVVPQSDGSEVSIHALDAETGDERWTVSATDARIRGPVAASGHLVATSQDRHVNTGRESLDSPRATIRAYEIGKS